MLEKILQAQRLLKELQEDGIVATVDRNGVQLLPEAYLKLFPGELDGLRDVQKEPGVFVTMAENVDGVQIFTRIPASQQEGKFRISSFISKNKIDKSVLTE